MKDFVFGIDIIGIVIASASLVFTILMYLIAKKELKMISNRVTNISNSVSSTLERLKWKLIYERLFPKGKISNADFEKSVMEAYHDIVSLIPNLDREGKQDEDYYLGEWLLENRPEYEIMAGKSKNDAAYLIYSIRKKQY